ncbi:MAG TPA: TetR/AcrR family transcriptional regulator [Sphingopyxis sp.]|nr:TetR/AcrR family transcriptional regulator [Sphingopyxis sp.]
MAGEARRQATGTGPAAGPIAQGAETTRPTRYTPRKHDRRRAEIVELATRELNEHGVRGLVMADVAAKAGMSKANLSYYFRRKEDLAARCFDDAIEAYREMIACAAVESDAASRVRALVGLYFERNRAAIAGTVPPLAILSDIRALEADYQARAVARYGEMLMETAALIDPEAREETDLYRSVPRAQTLLVQLFWSAAWISQYEPGDHPQVARRLGDIIIGGVAPRGFAWRSDWASDASAIADEDHAGPERAEFFRTATGLINRLGYRGASIDRIAAAMNVTKGAVYHHHVSKDELLRACFDRSFRQMWGIIRRAGDISTAPLQRIAVITAALVAFQTSDRGPFLRDTALTSLPMAARLEVLAQMNRITLHLASIVTDGITAGEIRPVDPLLAAQFIIAGVNAADEINRFIPAAIVCNVVDLCVPPLLSGIFFDAPDQS